MKAGSRRLEAGGRRSEAGGRRPEAGGRRPEAGGRRQEAEAGGRNPTQNIDRRQNVEVQGEGSRQSNLHWLTLDIER